jgi:hypothetical protein
MEECYSSEVIRVIQAKVFYIYNYKIADKNVIGDVNLVSEYGEFLKTKPFKRKVYKSKDGSYFIDNGEKIWIK